MDVLILGMPTVSYLICWPNHCQLYMLPDCMHQPGSAHALIASSIHFTACVATGSYMLCSCTDLYWLANMAF